MAGLLAHVKFEHFLNIFIGVIAISCFIARDAITIATAFVENSLMAHRHVKDWTINCHLKSGGVWPFA